MSSPVVDRSRRTALPVALLIATAAVLALSGCRPWVEPTPAPPEVIQRGEEVYRSAGDVGCAACHGEDGRGIRGTAPSIVGRPAGVIERALDRVPQMRFIDLDDEEIEAVAAYLQQLR